MRANSFHLPAVFVVTLPEGRYILFATVLNTVRTGELNYSNGLKPIHSDPSGNNVALKSMVLCVLTISQ